MSTVTATEFATWCKGLKAQVIAQFPEATRIQKKHVATFGYVYFVLNGEGGILAKVYSDNVPHPALKATKKMVIHV